MFPHLPVPIDNYTIFSFQLLLSIFKITCIYIFLFIYLFRYTGAEPSIDAPNSMAVLLQEHRRRDGRHINMNAEEDESAYQRPV
jgi:hypothetical protein